MDSVERDEHNGASAQQTNMKVPEAASPTIEQTKDKLVGDEEPIDRTISDEQDNLDIKAGPRVSADSTPTAKRPLSSTLEPSQQAQEAAVDHSAEEELLSSEEELAGDARGEDSASDTTTEYIREDHPITESAPSTSTKESSFPVLGKGSDELSSQEESVDPSDGDTCSATVRELEVQEEEEKTEGEEMISTTIEESGPDTPTLTHDSMVTVRLSEAPALTLDTSVGPIVQQIDSKDQPSETRVPTRVGRDQAVARPSEQLSETEGISPDDDGTTLQEELPEGIESKDTYSSNEDDEDDEEVDWEQLEKKEDEQTKDEETDNSTALLLARLEQENAKLATNPKSIKVQAAERLATSRPRPPSMAQLQQMVNGPTPTNLRYSMLPPPPMTDLEFYSALVKDYQQTAARLPTLLSNKIRKGIPPPLRGVVWQSMSGGRDATLEEQYERLGGESSPYEPIIGKDLGRSFPGVDMFRDPEGDGQRMLGRVLKAFSLYDTKIGYCQGLAFLVGPLLMHMPDKQAFCVLVRLMDRYDLRECFLPDLSGLHVRIYQFRELLRHNLPSLASHLEDLQVDPAYVSQWFLSFFAVTCPLPMLFRIYDVIFAEGASETLMRVALSLMRKNETRLLACTELDDVMQLLLSRGLWDCYHYNADEFVQDFVSLTGEVSRENLAQLDQGYRESQVAAVSVARSSAITNAATRFLGRIWATSVVISPKTTTLSPHGTAPPRPLSTLRRSTSKQSLASTLNSMEASSVSVASSVSTTATTTSRDSANTDGDSSSRESTPVGPKTANDAKTANERYLNSQIEDLLTALSELQRNHALLTDQLQREQEERDDDRRTVRSLLDALRRKADANPLSQPLSGVEGSAEKEDDGQIPLEDDEDKTGDEGGTPSPEDLSGLLEKVESRFEAKRSKHRSSIHQSKSQLRDELGRAKEQLGNAVSQSQDYSRRIQEMEQEMTGLKDQLRDSHAHARNLHQDKQRLEKQMHGLRVRSSALSVGEPVNREHDPDWNYGKSAGGGGLRELKLGRSKSTPSQAAGYSKRASSLGRGHESSTTAGATSPNENEGLLSELVQAKTAEAIARQEAEEAKQKLEAFRKAYGLAPGDTPSSTSNTSTTGSIGMFGRLTGQAVAPASEATGKPAASKTAASASATTTTTTSSGGFWGWRR